ncbi:iron-only hydrogenase system regulator [Brachyspira hyodysenteriae]|uniref:TM1266 family iron-only hydrogenase system putative regulator n=1 Tax=Brachyspira hyodysenteriae TaxID=159 RepID=UPI002B2587D9|nr:TM1266 family iron-only hydrogenase system putative regulator [Brachyspira hyodysenteriae]WPC37708.1 iron-only hydrogenase system regulator [Brachyspira hyodysenteriae]
MENYRIAVVGIIVEETENVSKVNEILHDYSDFIIGRMGIPYREENINIISIVLNAPNDKINSLTGKLGMLKGVSAKALYANKK